MSHFKTICRTLFYQYLLLFISFALGFYFNAEWIGFKSPLLYRSFNNIFYPTKFNEELLCEMKEWGSFKLWNRYGCPNNFKIIEDAFMAEEWYWAKFTYTDVSGINKIDIDRVRISWKPWEYYFEHDVFTEEEKMHYLKYGDLNSNESDKAFGLKAEKQKLKKTLDNADR